MKIVDRATFLALPAGTLFQKYDPLRGPFGELEIKEASLMHKGSPSLGDFVTQSIGDPHWFVGLKSSDELFDAYERMERGEDLEVDLDFAGRDGLFDVEQRFAVWSKVDHQNLMHRLNQALSAAHHTDFREA